MPLPKPQTGTLAVAQTHRRGSQCPQPGPGDDKKPGPSPICVLTKALPGSSLEGPGATGGQHEAHSNCQARLLGPDKLGTPHPPGLGAPAGSRGWSLTLWAVPLLPRGGGLACPAIGSTGHDPAAPLAGTWLSRRLAFAVPRLGPFNFHLDKWSCGLGRCRGSRTPCPSDTPLRTYDYT